MKDSKKFGTVDDYFSALDGKTRKKMDQIRKIIRKVSPEAVELIGYGMPAFKLDSRNLIYYAAAKVHIGLYPGPDAIIAFEDQLADYR
ncbi:MAG: DUF1801 domain-containing protein, partial [Gemmatimonadaceae bacterium]|nr:DUF1801 domain-containing protein [Chitinophagaceae bacterium]